MSRSFWLLLLASSMPLLLAGGCASNNQDGLIACTNLPDEPLRSRAALLSDAPSFSATEIAPGDPVTLAVPVNEFAKNVRVTVHSVDDPDLRLAVASRDTQGDETLLFPLADTNVPAGVYVLKTTYLTADEFHNDSGYDVNEPQTPYVLTVVFFQDLERKCLTNIPAASLAVVGDVAVGADSGGGG